MIRVERGPRGALCSDAQYAYFSLARGRFEVGVKGRAVARPVLGS